MHIDALAKDGPKLSSSNTFSKKETNNTTNKGSGNIPGPQVLATYDSSENPFTRGGGWGFLTSTAFMEGKG